MLEFLGLHESHCYSESDLGMGQGGASMNAALDAESAAVLETIKGLLA